MKHISKIKKESVTRLCEIAYRESGLVLKDEGGEFLENRLLPELKKYNLASFEDYCTHLSSAPKESAAIKDFINKITTNTTSFYRERHHFDWLEKTGIGKLAAASSQRRIKVWSVACSSGPELYSTLISLEKFRRDNAATFSFEGLGTDISTKVLKAAETGVYDADTIAPIPESVKKWSILRSTKTDKRYRISDDIRNKASWRRLNLSDRDFGLPGTFDIIFLRNVLIYFDVDLKKQILRNVVKRLSDGGYLMLGHSETSFLEGLDLETVAPTIYTKHRRR
ncbi:MAG: protein-glutamate O-methyltransferase CheR [Pseudomonadota bacterium]